MEWVNTLVIRAIHTFRRMGFISPETPLKFLLLKHYVKLKFEAQIEEPDSYKSTGE